MRRASIIALRSTLSFLNPPPSPPPSRERGAGGDVREAERLKYVQKDGEKGQKKGTVSETAGGEEKDAGGETDGEGEEEQRQLVLQVLNPKPDTLNPKP